MFGIASSSYDGAEDVAFVTPTSALLEIRVPKMIGDKNGVETETLRELAARGLFATG